MYINQMDNYYLLNYININEFDLFDCLREGEKHLVNCLQILPCHKSYLA